MDQKTREALEASIEHWERNAKAELAGQVTMGPNDCALCRLFLDSASAMCVGCPVKIRTGREVCYGTPYNLASRAWDRWCVGKANGDDFRAEAQAEVDFLKSLREPSGAAR